MVRIAVCGAGSAAVRAHLPALASPELRDATTIVGIADQDLSRAKLAAGGLREARAFDSVTAMIDATAPDLLVVATPPSAHEENLRAAVEREVDVLCEKPIGLSRREVASLEGVRSRHPDALLATVLQYRHAPTWQRFRDALSDRDHQGDRFRLSVSVERPGTDPLSSGGWRAEPFAQGGILGDHAVHYLALCWGIDPGARVASCERLGAGASEVAVVKLAMAGGSAEITVSYRGTARSNSITLEQPAGRPVLHWENAGLTTSAGPADGTTGGVESLSDRELVNSLYGALYTELVAGLSDAGWRTHRTRETMGVATLLAESLSAAGAGNNGRQVP